MNRYFFEFAMASLAVEKFKNIFMVLILAGVVFVLSSVVFLASSLKHEVLTTAKELPQIIVQKRWGGRLHEVEAKRIYPILDIEGVTTVIPRVWGSYHFEKENVNLSIIGIDRYDYAFTATLQRLVNTKQLKELKGSIVVGEGVMSLFHRNFFDEYFNFILPDGSLKQMKIAGSFKGSTQLYSNDVVLMDVNDAREILSMAPEMVTDLAVEVANADEVQTVAAKIRLLYPDVTVRTKESIIADYEHIYDFKSGLFLVLYLVALVTLFLIVSDRLGGVSHNQRKEIAILKSVGWSIGDIIRLKFIESGFIATFAYMLGTAVALFYVFWLHAPLLGDIFRGFSALRPELVPVYHVELSTYVMLFLATVPLYLAAVIVPAWRVAVMDVDEVLR